VASSDLPAAPADDSVGQAPPAADGANGSKSSDGDKSSEALHLFVKEASKADLAVWLALLGATFYAVLRIVSDLFYARFGLSPEDLGLDQARMLGLAAGTLVLVVPLMAGALFLVAAVRSNALRWEHRWWLLGAAITLVVAFLVVNAISTARNVFEGRSMSSIERLALPWDATVVQVRWIGGEQRPVDLEGLACGVFLGADSGIAFLVDPRNDRTLRLSSSDVVISTPRYHDYGPDCRDGRLIRD
jgi:hypothetical protein